MPERSLRECYDDLWSKTRTEEELQAGSRGIVGKARRVLREAQRIRVEGHPC